MKNTEQYYDEFSKVYDDRTGDPYHAFLDEAEIELVYRYGRGKRVLECGSGTGLILEQVQKFAASARGIDLSAGMIKSAQSKGLDVSKASVTDIPFPDSSFDLAFSFKVLAHVEDIDTALSEMTRVVVPGGHIIAEFYNPYSVRHLVRLLRRPLETGEQQNDHSVYYRADSPGAVAGYLPDNLTIVDRRGIRVISVFPSMFKIPVLGSLTRKIERYLMDVTPGLGGFYCIVARKD